MIVFVEGIDRIGKTTLCDKLVERGFIKLKDAFMIMNNENQYNLLKSNLANFAFYSAGKIDTTVAILKQLANKYNIVVDRMHLTELVYGKAERKGITCEYIIKSLEESICKEIPDHLLILMKPTNSAEAYKRAEANMQIHEMHFEAIYHNSILNKLPDSFTCNYETIDNIVNEVLNRACKYDFYFASPFFNETQIEREERLKAHLRNLGYTVFSPKEECIVKPDATLEDRKKTFEMNCESIRNCKAVFAVFDEKDTGTIWETGFAYGVNKPVIFYAETLGEKRFNLMLAQSGVKVFLKQEQITKEVLEDILYKNWKTDFAGVIE